MRMIYMREDDKKRDADSLGYILCIRVMFILSILSSQESRFRRKSGIHTPFTI